jgi:hypothetical protein
MDNKKSNSKPQGKNSLDNLMNEMSGMLNQFDKINIEKTLKVEKTIKEKKRREELKKKNSKINIKKKLNPKNKLSQNESTKKEKPTSTVDIELDNNELKKQNLKSQKTEEIFLEVTPESKTNVKKDLAQTNENKPKESYLSIKEKLEKIKTDVNENNPTITKNKFSAKPKETTLNDIKVAENKTEIKTVDTTKKEQSNVTSNINKKMLK